MLVENTERTIGENIFLEGFELNTVFVRYVDELNRCEVGKACFWADTGKFRYGEVDDILLVGILIFPCFDDLELQFTDVVLSTFVAANLLFLLWIRFFTHWGF